MSHEALGLSDDWYTPKFIFDALDCRFDLDVAAPADGPLHVPCARWLSELGELAPWDGFVWMNPPFGGRNGLGPWMSRFAAHANGVALTPDRVSAPWFQKWAVYMARLLFLPRVRFIRPDGSIGEQPTCGTVLWGIGERAINALESARELGLLLGPA